MLSKRQDTDNLKILINEQDFFCPLKIPISIFFNNSKLMVNMVCIIALQNVTKRKEIHHLAICSLEIIAKTSLNFFSSIDSHIFFRMPILFRKYLDFAKFSFLRQLVYIIVFVKP